MDSAGSDSGASDEEADREGDASSRDGDDESDDDELDDRTPWLYTPGTSLVCQWVDGSLHVAEVVHRRPRGNTAPVPPAVDGMDPSEVEFYVHYVGYDKRLDEWLSLDRIEGPLEQAGTGVDAAVVAEQEAEQAVGSAGRSTAAAAGGGGRDSSVRRTRSTGGTAAATAAGGTAVDAALAALEDEHEEVTRVKNVGCIQLGRYEIDTWYYSPYPEEYCGPKLYLCEFTLKYFRKLRTLERHRRLCPARHPPGREIYREHLEDKPSVSVFEIDGKQQKLYCQNLCLLAKLFLDHKTLYFDVEPFMFYVVCEVDEYGAHPVGYYSKEKVSSESYNLACILTLPPHQRKGFGKFIISLSYQLSVREGRVGSPEKPLSDLGKVSYRSYWTHAILNELLAADEGTSIRQISKHTGIMTDDIISTLHILGMISVWKGQYVVTFSKPLVEEFLSRGKSRRGKRLLRLCKPELLHWTPLQHDKAASAAASVAAAAAVLP